jgi:glucose-6-phosphate isomerase
LNRKEDQLISYNHQNALKEKVGDQGLTEKEISACLKRGKKIITETRKAVKKGEYGFANLPDDDKTEEEVRRFALRSSKRFEQLVVIGMGGSALGAIALNEALSPLSSEFSFRLYPRLIVLENIDPTITARLAATLNLKRTLFIVVSKSGKTVETLANFLALRELLIKEMGAARYNENIVAITSEGKGPLFKIAKKEGYKLFFIPDDVGGRFSVLSPVGLLPAALTGINTGELLSGASFIREKLLSLPPSENPAFLFALIHFLLYRKGKINQVILPYATTLRGLACWYRQLLAESLGKKDDKGASVGQTPVVAVGASDQHSQLQLYLDGPNDKEFLFLELANFPEDITLPETLPHSELPPFLKGKKISEVLSAEKKATELALTKAGKPNTTITIPGVTAFTLGELFFFFELAVVFSARLFGVNPFDQPAVEEIKRNTASILSSKS